MPHDADEWIKTKWLGKRARQLAVTAPEYGHLVGRESTVDDLFFDEMGALHVHTEDGYWCPARLMSPVEEG
jgi:hypothetical protein